MICYFHPNATQPPAHLVGARDLCARPTVDGGVILGIGPSYLCGGDPKDGIDLEDGWKVWVNGEIDTYHLYRQTRGQPVVPIEDTKGRAWAMPMILNASGGRVFQVGYAGGWKPVLTPIQHTMMEMAASAAAVLASLSGETHSDEDMAAACTMSATAMTMTNHLTVEVIQKLGIMDDRLAIGGLVAMISKTA